MLLQPGSTLSHKKFQAKLSYWSLLYAMALLSSGALLNISLAYADSSLWYKDGDPLQTQAPPAIPLGYLQDTGTPCSPANLQSALSLADVTEAALCNNPQTREVWASARVQAAQVGVAKSAYLPTVTDNVGTNLNWSTANTLNRNNPYSNLSNSLVASYLLYDFGNRDATLENARQLLQAASATQSATVQSILLATVNAYYQVQAGVAALDAVREAERAAEESFKAAEARYKAGITPPADKLQAQTALAQASLTRITAEGTLKTAYGTLANLMGLSANSQLKLMPSANNYPQQKIEQDISDLIEQARNRRPDLIASEAQVKAAQATIDASRAAAKPTVSLALSNSMTDGSSLTSNNTSAIGVTVAIPLFAGYGPTYRIKSAEAAADVRSAQRDRLRLQISLDVWSAYQNLHTATESIIAADILVKSAEESSRVALGRYKAGVGNILDALNAQSALASARQQRIQASLNWNIARTTLAQSIGGLDNAMIQSLPEGNAYLNSSAIQPSGNSMSTPQ